MSQKSLTQTVIDRLSENADRPLFSQAALDALSLSDKFEIVTAREYVLPLDALAGFPRQVKSVTDEY